MPGATRLTALAQIDPGKASSEIISAYRRNGTAEAAARQLGITRRTFDRLVRRLDIEQAIATERAKLRRA